MKIREFLKKIREGLKSPSIYEVTRFHGLPVEYWECLSNTHNDGHLDELEKPHYIAVNPDLPEHVRVYVIAREFARFAQQRHFPSTVFNRPWKLSLLATAPVETREKLYRLDLEFRTHFIFSSCAKRSDIVGFFKHPHKKFSPFGCPLDFSPFIFWKLRIRNFIYARLSPLRFVKASRLSLSSSL
jgi:hypothetical protein